MRSRSERGFALPLTILVLALITLLLTAAFVRAGAERRVGESGADMVDALTIAQSGLYQYLDYYTGLSTRPADGDSVFFASIPPGGNAGVVARVIYLPADTTESILYLITSVGTRIDPSVGAQPRALRTVTQLAEWRSTGVTPTAAALAYEDITGNLISQGTDISSCGQPAITGFDDNGLSPSNNNTLINNVGIDWAAIDAGAFEPDYTSLQNLNSWSSYVIEGDATLSQSGNGLLIVKGSLTTTGFLRRWDGIVLVGEATNFNAFFTTIDGMLITGLNDVLPGPPPGPSVVGGLAAIVRYHACNIGSAMTSTTGFAAITNTWFDRWMGN